MGGSVSQLIKGGIYLAVVIISGWVIWQVGGAGRGVEIDLESMLGKPVPTPIAQYPTSTPLAEVTVVPTLSSPIPTSVPSPTVEPEDNRSSEEHIGLAESPGPVVETPSTPLRLENYGLNDFLIAQSNETELFYIQPGGNVYSAGDFSFGSGTLRDDLTVLDTGNFKHLRASDTSYLAAIESAGNVTIDGDLVTNQTATVGEGLTVSGGGEPALKETWC